MSVEISVLCKLDKRVPEEQWRSIYDPVFATAFYLGERLRLKVTPLLMGRGPVPQYLRELPFAELHLLDQELPEAIDLYDLASVVDHYIGVKAARLVLTPADGAPFPVLAGAIAASHGWPFVTMVTAVEVFNNKEIYAVRPTFGGNLTQILFSPCVLSVSSFPRSLKTEPGPELPVTEIPTESVGKDKLLIMARADMAPTSTGLPPREPRKIPSCAEAVNWLFEE